MGSERGERFISPCPLPNDIEREILNTLIEEAAEVIQRATKLLRFGRDEVQPDQPLTNKQRLSEEIGDFFGMADIAVCAGLLDLKSSMDARDRKAKRFEKYRQFRPETANG